MTIHQKLDLLLNYNNNIADNIFNLKYIGKAVSQAVTSTITVPRKMNMGSFLFTCATLSHKTIKINNEDISSLLTELPLFYTTTINASSLSGVNGKVWLPPSDLELLEGDIVSFASSNGGSSLHGILYKD